MRAHAEVLEAYRRWQREHPEAGAEQFVAAMSDRPIWPAVVGFIAARLAEPDQVRLEHELRYGERVDSPSPAQIHHEFLGHVLAEYELSGVVTTNYDLLAERTLRHRPMKRKPRPGFYYAGIAATRLMGASAFSVQRRWIDVAGTVPLCKLHGSLNWTRTRYGDIEAYADCRPAFRGPGASAIVAPRPEKPRPSWLDSVWEAASQVLSSASVWLVVGYSAPTYDQEVRRLLEEAARPTPPLVHVIDPDRDMASRFRDITAGVVRQADSLESFLSLKRQHDERAPGS